jgi:hypothetical protein
MEYITIKVKTGAEERMDVQFSQDAIQQMYDELHTLKETNKKTEEELKKEKQYRDMYSKSADDRQKEIDCMHTLFTAMGVKEQTDSEDSWNRKKLDLVTRMALFISTNK